MRTARGQWASRSLLLSRTRRLFFRRETDHQRSCLPMALSSHEVLANATSCCQYKCMIHAKIETTLSLFKLCVYLHVRAHHSIRECVCVLQCGQSCHASHTCSCHVQRALLFVDKGIYQVVPHFAAHEPSLFLSTSCAGTWPVLVQPE